MSGAARCLPHSSRHTTAQSAGLSHRDAFIQCSHFTYPDTMSSNEEVEIKGGHPPAMKVGGVRIPQRHKGLEEKEGAQAKPHKDNEEDQEEEEIISKSPPKPPVMVSGVIAKVDKDFPTAAVKHTHEKPVPTHDSRPAHNTKPAVIQQPRK